jgi:hypothetical protein
MNSLIIAQRLSFIVKQLVSGFITLSVLFALFDAYPLRFCLFWRLPTRTNK